MSKPNDYILQVGVQGSLRLQLLDEIYGPYTQSFLKKIGLSPNLQILEVGCGTGNTSCWLAQQLGKYGKVIGVDINEEQLHLAQMQARTKNLKNVEFIPLSIFDLDELEQQFDLVFSRFLLVHLTEPENALFKMLNRVKPNGILACDEQMLSAARSYPFSPAFTQSIALIKKVIEKKHLDYDFGQCLYGAFRKLNLQKIGLQTIQPALSTEQQKMLWPLFLQEAKAAIIASQSISEQEFDDLLLDLLALTHDNNTYVLSMQNFQTWGTKTESPP